MVVFRGELYASSLYRPAGFFRYRGGDAWQRCPLPADGRRVVALGVFNGHLYAGSYDSCSVCRFDGKGWEAPRRPGVDPARPTRSRSTQGELFVGTWPNGQVFRLDDGKRWVAAGRLGEEKEVMGMAVHNGKLYAGTLPLAEVYRLDDGTRWTRTGRLDLTPDVRYRRAWSMAVFDGRLFCGTLPSGRVHALEVGQSVTLRPCARPGLAAPGRPSARGDGSPSSSTGRASRRRLRDGPPPLDLTNRAPLRIGFGAYDHFRGSLSDLRLYDRALSAGEIAALTARDGKASRP